MFDGLFGMGKSDPINVDYDNWLGYTPPGSSSTDTFDFSPERTETIKTNLANDGFNVDGFGNSSWFGKSGILPTAFQGLSALGGLMQAYTGFKGLQLAKDQLQNSIKAFRTQFDANKTSLANQGRNASATNYAMHNGLARSFNQDEQNRVADAEYDRINKSYKSYV